ncbi:MAG: DUF4150 domain-containing protein [Phycisphaerales bacterium]|nr:DUF4150 domain-containing protein [Phycisphaerales bacterium]
MAEIGFPVACMVGGECSAFPDRCSTPNPGGGPPVLINYPNASALPTAVSASPSVFVLMTPVITMASVLPTSTEDEPGVYGGESSKVNLSETTFITGSSRVYACGQPVVYLGCATMQNLANCEGALVRVDQGVVLTAP